MNKSNNSILFVIPALIWGSTWYAIKFQLGPVDPLLSVAYRFGLATLLLILFCILTKRSLRFSVREHARIALQGALLFGFNYWLVYQSETYLSSGLVAVGFSTLIFFNIFFGAIFLGNKIDKKIILGAISGLIGTAIIFRSELLSFEADGSGYTGLALLVASVMIASLGNIASAKNSSLKIPVIQATALGMGYGALIMFVLALFLGKEFIIDTSLPYLGSLAYLTIFGSIVAFSSYLTLISKIGPGKAAYAIVVVPVVAVTISTFLEDFNFTAFTALGMLLLLTGNVLALYKKAGK
ncbi:MAG: EamA family transporter [Roseivirga sp.]|nr:EamA family transporter [Roseivirga sp.]